MVSGGDVVSLADAAWAADRMDHRPTTTLSDSRLPLRFWRDLDSVVPPDRLVRRLLGTSALAVIFGEPGCGKTFMATDLALSVALGRPWFGRAVTRGAVIYVAAEGAAGLTNRIVAYRKRHAIPSDVPFVVVPVAINLGPGGRDANKVIEAAEMVAKTTGLDVVLIVIDTLARTIGEGDEQTAQGMGAFVAACDRIRASTGATVMIIHHRGKNALAGARGSSALLAAADTAIEVEKRKDGRSAKVVKQKDGADGLEFGFDLDVVEIGVDGEELITSCVVVSLEKPPAAALKVSALEKRFLDVLRNVTIDHGTKAPHSSRLPPVTLVLIETLRNALKSAGVTDRDKPANERSQWRRLTTSLANKGLFRVDGEHCWLARDAA